MILVLTDKFDKHADIVCEKLIAKGLKYFRLDLDTESLKNTYITFVSGEWIINKNNITTNSKSIHSVWARRAFVELSLEEKEINDAGFKIWRGEWNKTLLGLYNSIKNINWLLYICIKTIFFIHSFSSFYVLFCNILHYWNVSCKIGLFFDKITIFGFHYFC